MTKKYILIIFLYFLFGREGLPLFPREIKLSPGSSKTAIVACAVLQNITLEMEETDPIADTNDI